MLMYLHVKEPPLTSLLIVITSSAAEEHYKHYQRFVSLYHFLINKVETDSKFVQLEDLVTLKCQHWKPSNN